MLWEHEKSMGLGKKPRRIKFRISSCCCSWPCSVFSWYGNRGIGTAACSFLRTCWTLSNLWIPDSYRAQLAAQRQAKKVRYCNLAGKILAFAILYALFLIAEFVWEPAQSILGFLVTALFLTWLGIGVIRFAKLIQR